MPPRLIDRALDLFPPHALWAAAVCALALSAADPAPRRANVEPSRAEQPPALAQPQAGDAPAQAWLALPAPESDALDRAIDRRRGAAPRTPPPPTPQPAAPRIDAFREVGRLDLPGAEIIAWDSSSARVLVTCADGRIAWALLGADGALTHEFSLHVAALAGLGEGADVTHVAIDPAGRGFAAASVAPADFAARAGRVVFFDLESGRSLRVVAVGHNPDMVKFTDDGGLLLVANEGQPARSPTGELLDPPGSLSVIDLRAAHDARGLAGATVETLEFAGPAMQGLAGVRIHPRNRATPELDLEPESIALAGSLAFVALQENSAVAVFDLASRTLERVAPLPAIVQTIDASDRDGGANIDHAVACWPMPDHIAIVNVRGSTFLITANEGDRRFEVGADDDLADHARLADLASAGALSADASSLASPEALGRLVVCSFSGDTDSDGRIDVPHALGARSVSAWDAGTLQLVGDTGAQFERAIAQRFPARFNADSSAPDEPDARSDNSGPEPEGLAVGVVNGRTYAFIGLERPGLIGAVDLTDPARPSLRALFDAAGAGGTAPEGLLFIDAASSPTGRPLLLAAFEGSGLTLALEIGL